MTYQLFTVDSGTVSDGAIVKRLRGASIDIPAIIVGEDGRGRELGVIPVQGMNPGEVLHFAMVDTTKSGRPKLVAASAASTDDHIIVVFLTKIWFRGSNSHTGDRLGWECRDCGMVSPERELPETCPGCNVRGPHPTFSNFPGTILVSGRIAEGTAGRMGSGDQMVAVVPKGQVFRTGYSGRLCGPSAHYYMWDGERLLSATWSERMISDLF